MKALGSLLLTLATLVPAAAAQEPAPAPRAETLPTVNPEKLGVLPADADRRFAALKAKVQPGVWSWVEKQARVEAHRPAPDPAALRGEIAKRFGAGLPPAEVDAVSFLVLSQANQDLEADMHGVLGHAQIAGQPQAPKAETDLHAREEASRRLQMAMDRRSKLIGVLSAGGALSPWARSPCAGSGSATGDSTWRRCPWRLPSASRRSPA
jgi:hypothetical protein